MPADNEDDHVEQNGDNNHAESQQQHQQLNPEQMSDEQDEELESDQMMGMGLAEFIEHVRVKGRRGLHEEYAEIKARAPLGKKS